MELNRALEIFEYNKAMLTCDMSISRDPEHQDVSPDYYGKDAEDLYYAIVCAEEYIKKAIPIEWIKHYVKNHFCLADWYGGFIGGVNMMLDDWEDENGTENN